jgi:hypothetical protein
MPWSIALLLAVAALPYAQHVRAADPSEFSVAEKRLFIDHHLRGLSGGTTLEYVYTKRGSLEAPVDDTARVTVGPSSAGGGQSVKVQYLSATRRLELADIDAANANPVILYFLEHEVREMNRLTGGSSNYYRKESAWRWRKADGSGRDPRPRIATHRGDRIHIAPYQ